MITVHPTARIDCDEFVAGEGTIVRAGAEIYGRRVILGRESFIDEYAVIGGGSAMAGTLQTGDWFHMGMFAQVNTARDVTVGDEVGLGIGTRIFTHGAYLSEWDGFPAVFAPVMLGSHVWAPQATILPGVRVGDHTVIAAGSVVAGDLPAGVLAAGTPAKVVRENAYPSVPPDRALILARICREVIGDNWKVTGDEILTGATRFDVAGRRIDGPVTPDTERLREQLRRHGIRFRYQPTEGGYQPWGDS